MIWADSRSNGDAEPRPYPKSSTLCWPWHVQISVSGYKNNNIYKPYSFCPRCAFLHCEHSWTIPKHPNSSIWDGTSTVITCKYLQQDSSDVKAKNPWPWWHWIPCWCSWLWACNLETLEKTRKELVAMKNMLKVQPVRDSSMRRLTSFRFRQVSAARGFLSSKTRSSQFWPNWVALGKSTSTRSKEVRHSKWRKILQYAFLAVSRVFGFGMLGILRTYAVAFWSQQADAGESYSAKIVMFGFLQFFFLNLFGSSQSLRLWDEWSRQALFCRFSKTFVAVLFWNVLDFEKCSVTLSKWLIAEKSWSNHWFSSTHSRVQKSGQSGKAYLMTCKMSRRSQAWLFWTFVFFFPIHPAC